jgi:hypothetical protein
MKNNQRNFKNKKKIIEKKEKKIIIIMITYEIFIKLVMKCSWSDFFSRKTNETMDNLKNRYVYKSYAAHKAFLFLLIA